MDLELLVLQKKREDKHVYGPMGGKSKLIAMLMLLAKNDRLRCNGRAAIIGHV